MPSKAWALYGSIIALVTIATLVLAVALADQRATMVWDPSAARAATYAEDMVAVDTAL
jgi:hypothetical protein